MFDIILSILLFCSSSYMLSEFPQNVLDIFFVQFFAGIVICVGMLYRPVRKFSFQPFILFPILMCIFQFFWMFSPENTAAIFEYYNHFLVGMIFIYIIVTRTRDTKYIYKAIIYSLLLNCFFMLLQIYAYENHSLDLIGFLNYFVTPGTNKTGVMEKLNLGAMFGHVPRLTMFAILALPLLLKVNVVLYFIFSFSLGLFFVYAYPDPQVGVLVITVINLLIYLFSKFDLKKNIILFSIILSSVILFAFIYPEAYKSTKTSFSKRKEIYLDAYQQFLKEDVKKEDLEKYKKTHLYFKHQCVFIGHGINVMKDGLSRDRNLDASFINSYIFFVFGFGLVSLYFVFKLFYLWFRCFKFSAMDIVLIDMAILFFIEYPMEIKRLWLTVFAIISLKIIEYLEVKRYVYTVKLGATV